MSQRTLKKKLISFQDLKSRRARSGINSQLSKRKIEMIITPKKRKGRKK